MGRVVWGGTRRYVPLYLGAHVWSSGSKKSLLPAIITTTAMIITTAGDEQEMTRMAPNSLSLSDAVEGFLLACEARQLSPHTIRDYSTTLAHFKRFVGDDPPLDQIDAGLIARFMASLALPQPRLGAVAVPDAPLSKKTALNRHTGLSALWSWALRERLVHSNVVREVTPPRPEQRAIEPLSEADVRALLAVCDRTRAYSRPGKRACDNARPTALRDRLIIFLLLDTGMRVSELCGLTASAVDLRNRQVFVMGKGDKERALPVSAETAKVLWKYMKSRAEAKASAPLLVAVNGEPLTRTAVLQMLADLGERAGVRDVHPHRFRHTFAINMLRNGGNVYALQLALGHTTLEMVRTYLALAQADLRTAHEEASPVANWRLKG